MFVSKNQHISKSYRPTEIYTQQNCLSFLDQHQRTSSMLCQNTHDTNLTINYQNACQFAKSSIVWCILTSVIGNGEWQNPTWSDFRRVRTLPDNLCNAVTSKEEPIRGYQDNKSKFPIQIQFNYKAHGFEQETDLFEKNRIDNYFHIKFIFDEKRIDLFEIIYAVQIPFN